MTFKELKDNELNTLFYHKKAFYFYFMNRVKTLVEKEDNVIRIYYTELCKAN